MRHQPPQRRFLCWAGVLVMLVVLVVAVPLAGDYYLRAVYYYREDVTTEGCATQFEPDKTKLAGYHWGWWPLPGWVCEFEQNGRRWERRLR
jgi:hypothetical protein